MTLDSLTEKETLPVGDEDRIIPTRLAKIREQLGFIDTQIAALNDMKRSAQVDFDILVKRAKECGITTDAEYKIVEVPVYPKKRVDVAKLKEIAPDRYDLIIANIKSRLADKITAEQAKAETFIAQTDVKAVVRDKAILAMVIPEPTEPTGYEISIVKR